MSNLEKVKKGDTVVMLGFTGMNLGKFTVAGATKTELSIEAKNGSTLKFSRKSGKQVNVEEGKERYANRIVLPEDAPAKKERKKPEKPVKPVEIVEEDDVEEDDVDGILASMTLSELFEYAEEEGIDLSKLNKKQRKDKATVIEAIKEGREEDDEWEDAE